MTEERDNETFGSGEAPAPERYYAQLLSGADGVTVARLQEAMNEGARQSWRLVGVVNEPGGRGIILIWDQQGFISG
ncbi:hypothetical protein RxyAA322_03740 [Rubrobacter xylanophilus]|uniref:DUF4177 domain-containing protein n=1 Tax=Rubrobacter xylanophilus TaxID=49319 RepID=A0A510HEZ7_9ACTN|nr:hypothetical protein [Rubrobacter xylanophilus]BBL78520.1 hypothetical protein RxyAA322_03740 [Rubrobacter xylanophilus]